jgi:hypothetical protein
MDIQCCAASQDWHFEQILQLQKQNLFSEISAEQQQEQGFVYAEHTLELLKMMASHLPQIVAIHDGKVIAYTLAMAASMKQALPRLAPMFDQFDRSQYKGAQLSDYRFMVGGQVCVARGYRGLGLLSKLYHGTKAHLPLGYQLCVTEVATRNVPSLQAHLKMGFELASTYHDGVDEWQVVVWDMTA